jgi:hypothetical protein
MNQALALILLLIAFLALTEGGIFMHEDVHKVIDNYYGATNISVHVGIFEGYTKADASSVKDLNGYWLAHSINEIIAYAVFMILLIWTAGNIMRILD